MTAPALLTLALLSAINPVDPAKNTLNPLVSRAKEHDELLTKLQRDIFKVDRAIGETERLIAKSRNAPYLPDLQFRLAELYVEKSRYVYYLQAESRPEGVKGAIVSPETRLLKQKAVSLYQRLLREYPDFHDGDKVTFYLAHENRELGQFDEMLKILGDLVRKYAQSPLRLDAEQIIGDYYFDKADLVEAEKHYQAILESPPSPVHDLARYKMGWVRINQNRHADAVTFFEAAAASAPIPGVDPKKALNVKRESLLDLVFSYTEARPAKGALNYFEKLSESRSTYALALEKLGNRYFIKQQYEYAIPALRRLMQIQPDPELDSERAMKLYDSLKASKGKVPPRPEDISFLVRAAVQTKTDPTKSEVDRKKGLAEYEELARDLSTQLHVLAQRQDQAKMYLDSAEAYKVYLSLFRPEKHVRSIMQNRADALFAAHAFPEAARQFEELARYQDKAKDVKGLEVALYGALLSHFSALKAGEVEKITAFEVADARQALKLLGAKYIARFPRNEHVLEIKFNIARAYYDDGEFDRSAELFTRFALDHSDYKDAPTAGHLAMDSLRQRYDFKGMEETGRKFIASRLPPPFIEDVKKILAQSRAEALDELALRSSAETGDVIEGLLKVAVENKGAELGEKALYGAFTAARDKRDLGRERELANRLAQEYPKSGYLSNVLLTVGRHSAEAARFSEAAGFYEQVGQKLRDSTGLEGYLAGARLRQALGQYPEAIRDLEAAADIAGARKTEVLALVAQLRLKTKEMAKAKATAEQVLKLSRTNAAAAAVLAESDASLGARAEQLIPVLTPVTNGPEGQGEDGAKALWYLGELMFRQFRAIPGDQIEQKVAALQQLVGVYTQSASLGSPEWAVASLWKLGLAYQHIADAVEGSPVPAGLSAGEVQQFRNAVKEQVAPLKDQAEDAFKTCLARATQLEVFSPAVVGCRNRTDSPKLSLLTQTGSGAKAGNLAELQKKAESGTDPGALEALGLAYLDQRQVGLAQLTLARVTELEDNRASAHNALGITYLLQGEAMAARGSFGKALDADPTHDKARANLASLRCRFGDAEGAKRELSVLKDTSGLRGPDVDPEWKACR